MTGRSRRFAVAIWLSACLLAARAAGAQGAGPPTDGVTQLVQRLEKTLESGDSRRYADLLSPGADRTRAAEFAAASFDPQATRVVVRERDRAALASSRDGEGFRLAIEVFTEVGSRGRIATWKLDVRSSRVAADGRDTATNHTGGWAIANQEIVTSLEALYRLALTPDKQYAARNLTVFSEDFQLSLADGSAFIAETPDGITGLVLLGRGEMVFTPSSATERGQVKIFCGNPTLRARFDSAFVRLSPGEFNDRVSRAALHERAVDQREFRRATAVFKEEVGKSFGLDLADLSRDTWSLQPPLGDFLAEVRTRKFDTLTYARSGGEPEDITLFDRRRHRNISIYPSQQKLATRGRFYNEDDLVDFDVLDYQVDTTFSPDREWIAGRTRMKLKVRSYATTTLTLRLADTLTVQSALSDELGRLLTIRVRGQNSLVVNLPSTVLRDTELTLHVSYAGRLPPQTPDREAMMLPPRQPQDEGPYVSAEPSFLFSNRSYWYPQSTVTDYATATLRLTVPPEYSCVGSGELASGAPVLIGPRGRAGEGGGKLYVFVAAQPVRYLSAIISRFVRMEAGVIPLGDMRSEVSGPDAGGPRLASTAPAAIVSRDSLQLAIEANPRQQARGRELSTRAGDVLRYYASLIGDRPYPSFTLALVESELPGGHSPAYFAALNQPLPTSPYVWRNDPANFTHYPEFFLAHELAHQWWGQAVGWKNFHEQWISEGFAQYFAALYAQKHRGDDVFGGILRQLRRWSLEASDQGPIYLGYRLGHVKGNSRIFRALVYNKGAAVLHMLRRFVGDEAFFRGVRRFYAAWQFKKAGTEDVRQVFEAESHRSLQRFFERWIYESGIPRVRVSYTPHQNAVSLRLEQVGDVFDVPVTITLDYSDKPSTDTVVALTEQITELEIPLTGALREVGINRDEAALIEVVR